MNGKERLWLAGPEDLQKEIELFFEHLGRWKKPVFYFEKAWKPLCDVSETSTEIIVVADLSGVSPSDVSITVEGDDLTISGVRREPMSAPKRNYHRMEISYGPFERIVKLPGEIDADNARATYSDGFLEIWIPKTAKEPLEEVDPDAAT